MSTTTAQATTSSTTYFPKRDGYDIEPDEQWKAELKQRIEEGLLSMVKDTKRSLEQQLLQPDISEADRDLYKAEYTRAMKDIRNLATESYHAELDRERTERRWAAGIPIPQGWSQALEQEQREIMETIKRTAGRESGGSASLPNSPIEERRHTSTASRAVVECAAPTASTPALETTPREQTYDQSKKVRHKPDNIPPLPRERDEATASVPSSAPVSETSSPKPTYRRASDSILPQLLSPREQYDATESVERLTLKTNFSGFSLLPQSWGERCIDTEHASPVAQESRLTLSPILETYSASPSSSPTEERSRHMVTASRAAAERAARTPLPLAQESAPLSPVSLSLAVVPHRVHQNWVLASGISVSRFPFS